MHPYQNSISTQYHTPANRIFPLYVDSCNTKQNTIDWFCRALSYFLNPVDHFLRKLKISDQRYLTMRVGVFQFNKSLCWYCVGRLYPAGNEVQDRCCVRQKNPPTENTTMPQLGPAQQSSISTFYRNSIISIHCESNCS